MTTHEKNCLMYWAFNAYWEKRNNLPFPWHWDYFKLTWTDISELDTWADLCGIRNTEKSRARRCWERMKAIYIENAKGVSK